MKNIKSETFQVGITAGDIFNSFFFKQKGKDN